jgi:hypothetical protein
MMDNVEIEHVFCEYFDFSAQFSFHLLLYTLIIRGSGTRTIAPSVPDVTVD